MATKGGNGTASEVRLAVMANDINYIKQELHDFRVEQRESYVTKEEFTPIKKVVYGMIAVVLVTVGGAILNLIINR